MTIIDTTLYANGALRMSDHGRHGSVVLMCVPTGAQFTVPPAFVAPLHRYLAEYDRMAQRDPETVKGKPEVVYARAYGFVHDP